MAEFASPPLSRDQLVIFPEKLDQAIPGDHSVRLLDEILGRLDYPVALSLMVAPFLLQLGTSNPLARWLAVGTGVAALVLTLLTDHQTGVIRVLPYSFHLAVDFLVGLVFLAAPFAFGFTGIDAWYYWANGAAVLVVVGLHKPELESEKTLAFAYSPFRD